MRAQSGRGAGVFGGTRHPGRTHHLAFWLAIMGGTRGGMYLLHVYGAHYPVVRGSEGYVRGGLDGAHDLAIMGGPRVMCTRAGRGDTHDPAGSHGGTSQMCGEGTT